MGRPLGFGTLSNQAACYAHGMAPRLLIATGNPGKLREFRELLAGLPAQLVSLRDLGITTEAPESGDTYTENACFKACFYARAAGLLTLADDSGLDVDALGGQPGVQSARYGGPGLDDAGRVQLLLRNLKGVPPSQRTARFVCVLALAGPGVPAQTVRATVEGLITSEPRGEGGFGYDPVFYVPDLGQTLAEAPLHVKHSLSHRGRAARMALPLLQRLLFPI